MLYAHVRTHTVGAYVPTNVGVLTSAHYQASYCTKEKHPRAARSLMEPGSAHSNTCRAEEKFLIFLYWHTGSYGLRGSGSPFKRDSVK